MRMKEMTELTLVHYSKIQIEREMRISSLILTCLQTNPLLIGSLLVLLYYVRDLWKHRFKETIPLQLYVVFIVRINEILLT